MSVYEKLKNVQSQLKAPKSQYNSFGKYSYRNCEDILEATKPLLNTIGAVLVVGDNLELIGERYYIKATAVFIDCETGESVTNSAYAREELDKKGMDASQITGSTSSYARKYALNGLLCIDDTKDADTKDNSKTEQKQSSIEKQSQKPKSRNELLKEFESEIIRTGRSLKYFLDQAKVTETKYIKTEVLKSFIETLKQCQSMG